MCPLCTSTVALIATSATSTGWLAALVMKLRARTGAKKNEPKIPIRGVQNESSNCRVTS